MPFILRWPGRVAAERIDETSVVSGLDWLPTLCSLMGTVLEGLDIDDEDASAARLGKPFQRTKPLFWKKNTARSAIALRDGPWKSFYLNLNRNRGEAELYDLRVDAEERINVAAAHPDVVSALTAQVEAWNATLPTDYVKPDDKED